MKIPVQLQRKITEAADAIVELEVIERIGDEDEVIKDWQRYVSNLKRELHGEATRLIDNLVAAEVERLKQ